MALPGATMGAPTEALLSDMTAVTGEGAASAVAALTGGPGPAADAAAAPGLAAGARRGIAANAHLPS